MANIVGQANARAALNAEVASTVYAALMTTAPTRDDNTSAVEVAGNNYARVAITTGQWTSPTTNVDNVTEQSSNTVDITFPTSSGSWGTVVGVALYDAATVGVMKRYFDLTGGSQAIGTNTAPKIPTGQLVRTAKGG